MTRVSTEAPAATSAAAPAQVPAQSPRVLPCTEADLMVRQLAAIDAWNRGRRAAEQAADPRNASREVRMDISRRLEVLRAQHEALARRTARHLEESAHPMARRAPRRAVLVHRNEWFVNKVAGALEERGVLVVERLANGAEAVGAVVAEQPELLVVEDTLPMLPGEDVVRETRRYSPDTLVVAQVDYSDRIGAMIGAGATTAFTRRVPPLDVAAEIERLLSDALPC